MKGGIEINGVTQEKKKFHFIYVFNLQRAVFSIKKH